MPLVTEEDYERLADHLREIDSIVEPFSDAHGYILPRWPRSGRYPNRKMHRQSGVLWTGIQITMDLSPNGELFDEFFPEIPYTISGSVWVDDFDTLTRWHGLNIGARAIPFVKLVRSITLYFEHIHRFISSVDEATVRAFCDTSPLPRLPGS